MPTILSTWWGGTAAPTRSPSRSETSSRSSGASTSRRQSTRPSPVRDSSCAASCPGRTTSIRRRSRCPTTTPTSTPTRCCSTPAGDFMSRRGTGIQTGSLTLHPAGFVHGPQPGSVEAAVDATRTEETAVMIDTFAPLEISEAARAVADADYPWSWARHRTLDLTPGPGRAAAGGTGPAARPGPCETWPAPQAMVARISSTISMVVSGWRKPCGPRSRPPISRGSRSRSGRRAAWPTRRCSPRPSSLAGGTGRRTARAGRSRSRCGISSMRAAACRARSRADSTASR